jgi:ribosomal-protein-alanine N-acetyltransferase
MMNFVRSSHLLDVGDLARLHALSFDPPWSASEFRSWLERETTISSQVRDGNELIAFGVASAAGDDVDLLTIMSHPAARRTGAARMVLRAMSHQAASRGLVRWVLEVARDNDPARALYMAEGFREIGVRPGYYRRADCRVDAIVMSRP